MKKTIYTLLVVLFFYSNATICQSTFLFNRYNNQIAFVRMDSVHTAQTTIIEYKNYLVLIELPFIDAGSNQRNNLKEDITKAKKFIAFLDSIYPQKPVKYVLHSHWHQHSISGITPFFETGTTLITTSANWQYCIDHGLLDSVHSHDFSKQIIPLSKDSTLLSRTNCPIDVIYLDSTYTHKPSNEYLFFYLPKYKTLHASCMCATDDKDLSVEKDYLYSERLVDLRQAVDCRKIPVEHVIMLGRYFKPLSEYKMPVITYNYLIAFMEHGKTKQELVNTYTMLKIECVMNKKDSLLHDAQRKKLSPDVLNQAVYDCIKIKQFEKAVHLAQILILYSPGNINYIDTMGESYYLTGDLLFAKRMERIIKEMNPKFVSGEQIWEEHRVKGSY